jgi:hypothetical protein
MELRLNLSNFTSQLWINLVTQIMPLQANQSLKLTEPAVDDFARAKQTATIRRRLPRADWLPSLRRFAAAA